jgi:hypothetical protein
MKPGDIIFTDSGGLFSRLIRWITERTGNPIIMTHSAIVIDSNHFIESSIKAIISPIESLEKNKYYEIWSCQSLLDVERSIIVEKANSYFGRAYSIPKIITHAFDAILGKIFLRDIFLFRRLTDSDKYIICSWIVSCVYTKVGFEFTNPYYIATPDNIHDFVKKYNNWGLVKKKA